MACVIFDHNDWLKPRGLIPAPCGPHSLVVVALSMKDNSYLRFLPCFIMLASYPLDCSTYMSKEGPADARFCILGGVLQYHPKRDGRFPYLYHIPTHTLVHSPDHFKIILIRVVNTSVEARIRCAEFDKSLSAPLGPNAVMDEYGTVSDTHLPHFLTILFRFAGNETWHNSICSTLT